MKDLRMHIFSLHARLPEIFYRLLWLVPVISLPAALLWYFTHDRNLGVFLALSGAGFLLTALLSLLLGLISRGLGRVHFMHLDNHGILTVRSGTRSWTLDMRQVTEIQIQGQSRHRTLLFRDTSEKPLLELPWPWELSPRDRESLVSSIGLFINNHHQ